MNENKCGEPIGNKVRRFITEIHLTTNDGSAYELIECLRSKFELDIVHNPPVSRGCEAAGQISIKVYQLV